MLINKTSNIESNFSPINQLAFFNAEDTGEFFASLDKENKKTPTTFSNNNHNNQYDIHLIITNHYLFENEKYISKKSSIMPNQYRHAEPPLSC